MLPGNFTVARISNPVFLLKFSKFHLVTNLLSGALGVTIAGVTSGIVPGTPHTVVALTTFHSVGTIALPRVQTKGENM